MENNKRWADEAGFSFKRDIWVRMLCCMMYRLLQHHERHAQGLLFHTGWSESADCTYRGSAKGEQILDVCSAPVQRRTIWLSWCRMMAALYAAIFMSIQSRTDQGGCCASWYHDFKTAGYGCDRAQEVEGILFDRVLCDVPCSGYGVLARKSDIKVHMQSGDMDTLIPIQKAILAKSAEHVKEHGILVYSTCTLNKKKRKAGAGVFKGAWELHPDRGTNNISVYCTYGWVLYGEAAGGFHEVNYGT